MTTIHRLTGTVNCRSARGRVALRPREPTHLGRLWFDGWNWRRSGISVWGVLPSDLAWRWRVQPAYLLAYSWTVVCARALHAPDHPVRAARACSLAQPRCHPLSLEARRRTEVLRRRALY